MSYDTITLPDTLILTTTQDDIDHGMAKNCYRCPIARAALRALGIEDRFGDVEVHAVPCELRVSYYDQTARYALDVDAFSYIRSYDTDLDVRPETFIAVRIA